MKKIASILLCLTLVCGIAAGCKTDEVSKTDIGIKETVINDDTDKLTEDNSGSGEADFQKIDLSSNGWNIVIENIIAPKELSDVDVMLGYTSSKTNKVEFTANDGYKYLILKMSISKDGSSENIEWDNMYLQDVDGNKYSRMDDGFLEDLNMERMPGTTLNFGSNEGWIAFTVPQDLSKATLYYEFAKENIEHELDF